MLGKIGQWLGKKTLTLGDLELDHSKFRRKALPQETAARGPFSKYTEVIKYVSNILMFLLVAPVLVVTSLLSKATVLVVTNIVLALINLYCYIHDGFTKKRTLVELLVIATGIALLAFTIVMLTPSITIILPFDAILFKINIVAYAINGFEPLRDLVVGVANKFFERVRKWVGFKPAIVIPEKPLDESEHPEYLDSLCNVYTGGYHGNDPCCPPETKTYIANMQEVLADYIAKKKKPFWGFVMNKAEIAELQSVKDAFRVGKAKGAIDWVTLKINRKISKYNRKLKKADIELEQTTLSEETKSYFKNYTKVDASEQDKINHCRALLFSYATKQSEKIDRLNECLPVSQRPKTQLSKLRPEPC